MQTGNLEDFLNMLVLFQYTILHKQKETQICSYFLPCFDKNSTKKINH